jgi:hypothetical protein
MGNGPANRAGESRKTGGGRAPDVKLK